MLKYTVQKTKGIVCIVCHCLVLACKRYRTMGHMFLKPKDPENLRVNSLISLVASLRLGMLP
jgi:hypothetical protein